MNRFCHAKTVCLPVKFNASKVTGPYDKDEVLIRHYADEHYPFKNAHYAKYEAMSWEEALNTKSQGR